jgi:hypothetical protein
LRAWSTLRNEVAMFMVTVSPAPVEKRIHAFAPPPEGSPCSAIALDTCA